MSPKNLALLIDGDNAQLAYTKQIIKFCEVYGTLSIKRAYGDWKNPPLSHRSQVMTELSVELVQQNRVTKNATDFALAMDAGSILTNADVGIYFIVSSDNGFTTVCDRILQTGAKVIGIGSKDHTSSELRKTCTLFFDVEEIIENQNKASAQSKPAPKPKSVRVIKAKPATTTKTKSVTVIKPKPATPAKPPKVVKPKAATTDKPAITANPKPKSMPEMLVRAYQETPQQDGWVLLPQLRETLFKLDKDFKQHLDGKKLSTWIKTFSEQFEIAGHRVRMK